MSVTPDPDTKPSTDEAAPTLATQVRTGIQLLASVLGLAGYVYLIGGIVSWVRFGAARLPSDVATATLTSRQLFEVGFRSLILMAIVFSVMCVVAYLASGWRWSANGPDWHEVISRGGVANARAQAAEQHDAWRAQRDRAANCDRARRQGALAKAARATRFDGVADRAEQRRREAVRAAEEKKPAADQREVWDAHLGDPAVRIVAGFNTIVLSVVAGLLAARFVELLFPEAWWAIMLVGMVVFFGAHFVLSKWGPLRWPAWAHGIAWVLVVLVALFVTAPLGLLLIAGFAVSTLGRLLAKTKPRQSLAGLLRSPLPWGPLHVLRARRAGVLRDPPGVVHAGRGLNVLRHARGRLPQPGRRGASPRHVHAAGRRDIDQRTRGFHRSEPDQADDRGRGAETRFRARPSLAAFAMQALGFNAHPPTWFRADLRARRAACAGGSPAGLTIATEAPALGPGVIAGPAPPGGQAHNGEAPIERTTPAAIARLARLYQPTVLTTVADRFWPVSVGAVLQDVNPVNGQRTALCHLGAPKGISCATTTSLSGLVPSSSMPTDYLRFPAALRDDPSDQFLSFENGQSINIGSLGSWLAHPDALDPWYTAQVYFYYAGPLDSAAWPARARNPVVASGLIGLEYWFFYPFNYYPTAVGSELMQDAPIAGDEVNTDLHQGDWEHVTVLLDPRTLTPQWLYMARHADEGQFFPWTSPTLAFDGHHPVVQAAFGGHPTYDSHCGARPRALLSNLSADWVICGSGRFAFRAATTPLVDLARTSWACWKGHFGEAKPGLEVNALGESDNVIVQARTFVFVAAPVSPLWQAENGSLSGGTGPCARAGGPQAVELAGVRVVKSIRR